MLGGLMQRLEVTPITLKERIRPLIQLALENGGQASEGATNGAETRELKMEVRLGTCYFLSNKYNWCFALTLFQYIFLAVI